MLIYSGDDGAVVFVIAKDEADRIAIDHGEQEVCLPCADTLAAHLAIGRALHGELVSVDGAWEIVEIPD